MLRTLVKAKIHRATVTQADLNYVGSLTIDLDLMEMCDIVSNEQVHIVNVTNGHRMVTYAIEGERGSGVMCLNGAAARHGQTGDLIIVMTFGHFAPEEARVWKPQIVVVDERNRPVQVLSGEEHGTIVTRR